MLISSASGSKLGLSLDVLIGQLLRFLSQAQDYILAGLIDNI